MDRDEFMELVYETFADEPDNVLANGIIEAADAYAEHEKAQLSQEGTTSDTISRQAALGCLRDGQICGDCCRKAIEQLPSAQPEPHEGHWIKHKIRDQQFIQNGYELVRCSECGMETTANDLAGISLFGEEEPHYCPNCGAKMINK